jgi:hypothetical protein
VVFAVSLGEGEGQALSAYFSVEKCRYSNFDSTTWQDRGSGATIVTNSTASHFIQVSGSSMY